MSVAVFLIKCIQFAHSIAPFVYSFLFFGVFCLEFATYYFCICKYRARLAVVVRIAVAVAMCSAKYSCGSHLCSFLLFHPPVQEIVLLSNLFHCKLEFNESEVHLIRNGVEWQRSCSFFRCDNGAIANGILSIVAVVGESIAHEWKC